MSGTTACFDCDPQSPRCRELLQEIHDFISRERGIFGGTKGLQQRFAEQTARGASGPGTRSWINHENAIRNQQRGLRDRLEEYERRGCGPPPPGAWSWATRPVPSAAAWEENNLEGGHNPALYVAGAAATVGAGYVIYRGVRMLPSLLPPLWWTIPANAAIP
ncbi:MAG: hypothetical protein AAGN82_24835 [Myxococcota bacterium]